MHASLRTAVENYMLKPIPTRYAEILFRSRTEARWALLFDGLKLEWQYEQEGYQLKTGWYLPDFWFPQWQAFAEVKGLVGEWSDVALDKAQALCEEAQRTVLLLDDIRIMNPVVRAILPGRSLEQLKAGYPAGTHVWGWCCLARSASKGEIYSYIDRPNADETWNGLSNEWFEASSAARRERFDHRAAS